MRVLAVNAGSSSLKLSVLDGERLDAATNLHAGDDRVDQSAVRDFVASAGEIDAVGHRIVHGGTDYVAPTVIDRDVRQRLEALSDLAPLHQPKSLAALDTVSAIVGPVPAVACFDTAFHSTIPPAAHTYALPAEWRRRWPLRRFGFHGLSHAYAARRAAAMVGQPVESLRIVSCHLGAGASVTAIRHGVSVDTTMGFTPLEGLVMATRSGSVDPGLLLWLEEHAGIAPAELASALEHRSGLLGLAGNGDLRAVLHAQAGGDPAATLAVEVYLHRLRAAIAAMTTALEGLDILVFTGGVGEHAAAIRQQTADALGFLGISVDADRNTTAKPDCEIQLGDASVATLVIESREDLQISAEVHQALG